MVEYFGVKSWYVPCWKNNVMIFVNLLSFQVLLEQFIVLTGMDRYAFYMLYLSISCNWQEEKRLLLWILHSDRFSSIIPIELLIVHHCIHHFELFCPNLFLILTLSEPFVLTAECFWPQYCNRLCISAGCCCEDTYGARFSSRSLQGVYERGLLLNTFLHGLKL